MKGLLLKEFLILKPYLRIYAVMLSIYMLLDLTGNASIFASMISAILLILPMSTFSADELARWDKFAAALPGGRRKVVTAKYQVLLVVLAGAFVLSCAVNLAAALFRRDRSTALPELLLVSVVCVAVGLLLNCILFPFLFKYGPQKGRIILIVMFAIFFGVLALIYALIKRRALILPLPLPFWQGLPRISHAAIGLLVLVLLTAVLAISYHISCRIYDKKEF